MEIQTSIVHDDEIDLRAMILTIVRGWKLLILLPLVIGATAFGVSSFQSPVYVASSVLSIPNNISSIFNSQNLTLSTSPINTLMSDDMYQVVAEHLDMPAASLPTVGVTQSTTDKTVYIVAVQSQDAQLAAQVANTWADVGMEFINEKDLDSTALEENVKKELVEADRALVSYLEENGLQEWSWAELSALTGVGGASSAAVIIDENKLSAISPEKRVEIAELMRACIAAETTYSSLLEMVAEAKYAQTVNPPVVLKYAALPTESLEPKTLMNTVIGVAVGLMLAIFWIFTVQWWKLGKTEV